MHASLVLGSALVLGATSALHCFAMCGPLALFAVGPARGPWRALRHQLGRAAAYAALGAIAAETGATLFGWLVSLGLPHATLVPALAVAAALLWGAWKLVRPARLAGARPVRLGAKPRTPWLARVLGRLPHEPLLLGAVAALLPCGALHAALLVAASAGSPALGAAAMIAFAFASSPGLLAAAWLARAPSGTASRVALAAALTLGAVLAVGRPLGILLDGPEPAAACHPNR